MKRTPPMNSGSKETPSTDPSEETEKKDGKVRLHKLLAHRGIASRRKSEQLVASGLVSVNGKVVTEPGARVNPETDIVMVEGSPLPREPEPFLFLFYKPRGIVSTLHDPEGRPTLREFFPTIDPLLHIGRLDFQTEGALLLTNNGDLSQQILHPRHAIPRTYLVKIQGGVSPGHLERIARGGVRLDGRPVKPLEFLAERTTETNAWYRITLTEGRNREVRRLFEALNYFVLKLVRTAFGPLTLAGLEPGEYREVTPSEIRSLLTGQRPTHLPRTMESRHLPSKSERPRKSKSLRFTRPREEASGKPSSSRPIRPSKSPRDREATHFEKKRENKRTGPSVSRREETSSSPPLRKHRTPVQEGAGRKVSSFRPRTKSVSRVEERPFRKEPPLRPRKKTQSEFSESGPDNRPRSSKSTSVSRRAEANRSLRNPDRPSDLSKKGSSRPKTQFGQGSKPKRSNGRRSPGPGGRDNNKKRPR